HGPDVGDLRPGRGRGREGHAERDEERRADRSGRSCEGLTRALHSCHTSGSRSQRWRARYGGKTRDHPRQRLSREGGPTSLRQSMLMKDARDCNRAALRKTTLGDDYVTSFTLVATTRTVCPSARESA